MYLDGKPVICIVNEGTHFSAARFLENVSSVSLCSTIPECWAISHTQLLRKILVEQGSQFGDPFLSIAALRNLEVQRNGIGSHNSLELGKRFPKRLCSTFRKLEITFSDRKRTLLLNYAVSTITNTRAPDSLCPSALIFGEITSPFTNSETQHSRAMLGLRFELLRLRTKCDVKLRKR